MTKKELREICEKSAMGNDFGLMIMGLTPTSSADCEEKLTLIDYCGDIDRLDDSPSKLFHNLLDIREKLINTTKSAVELHKIKKIHHFDKTTCATLLVSFILNIPFDDLK